MAIGTELDFIVPDEGLMDELIAARLLPASFITFSGSTIDDDASVGDVLGTLSITAAYQGTPVWELVEDGDGSFAVNASTGVVTVAKALTAATVSIKPKARGIRPQIFCPTFSIAIADTGGGGGDPYVAAAVQFDGSVYLHTDSLAATDSRYVGVVVWQKYASLAEDQHIARNIWSIDPVNDGNTNYSLYFDSFTDDDHVGTFLGLWDYGGNAGGREKSLGGTFPIGVWNCIIYAADTQTGIVKVWRGDTDISRPLTLNFFPSVTGFNGHPFNLGGDGPGDEIICGMADYRLMVGTNLLTGGNISEATRRLFIDADGKPVDPAVATASLGAPTILFSGDATAWAAQAVAQGFTIEGSLTNATTSPSD